MKANHIHQLETKIEKLVEGAFNQLFRRRVSAHDIALSIARAMESALRMQAEDTRPIAPNVYSIYLNAQALEQLEQKRADLDQQFSQHIIELATLSDYQLLYEPQVYLEADVTLGSHEVRVEAHHSTQIRERTAAMQAIQTEKKENPKTQIIVNGTRTIWLEKTLVTIGRAVDNDIVLEDGYISRYHLQLRARDGTYILFDIQSRTGTLVNNARVREHRLRSGDVISIGQSRLVYMTDDYRDDEPPHTTSSFDAVEI